MSIVGNRNSPNDPKRANRIASSSVHQMWGVFDRGELTFVEWSEEEAKDSAHTLSQKDNTKPRPIDPRYSIARVFVLTTDIATLFLSDANHVLEEATHEHRILKAREEKMIAEAAKTKSNLGDDYWQPRYHAWLKMEAARRTVEALERGIVTTGMSIGGGGK